MNSINYTAMLAAADFVAEHAESTEIHTVTVILNGAHGGADVRIQGIVDDVRGGTWSDVEYVRQVR
jgi:ribosomal protein S11